MCVCGVASVAGEALLGGVLQQDHSGFYTP